MSVRTAAIRTFELLIVLLIVALLAGQFFGTPVLLSYVETGSMEPTLEPGDGFVAVPTAVAGPVEEGDVIVFEAEEIQGGGLTTHRVVGETDHGYVTKGDANPFTDQDGGEPPVAEGQIKAKALRANSEVVVLPHLGTAVVAVGDALETTQWRIAATLGTRAVLGAQGLGYLIGGLAVLAYALDTLVFGGDKDRSRSRSWERGIDARLVVAAFALLIVLAATAAMVVPAETLQIGLLSAEYDSDRPDVVSTGESSDITYEVHNGGLLPVVAYYEAGSDRVEPKTRELYIDRRGREELTVTVHAPPDTGYYPQYVVERRYLAILPRGMIRGLYELHPWMPLLAINGLLGGGFYLIGTVLVGRGRVRHRNRDDGGWRLRRALRWLYDTDR